MQYMSPITAHVIVQLIYAFENKADDRYMMACSNHQSTTILPRGEAAVASSLHIFARYEQYRRRYYPIAIHHAVI